MMRKPWPHCTPRMSISSTFSVNGGRFAEVERNLTRIHSEGGGMAHSTMKIRIEQVRFPSANVAIVHGIVELFNAPPPTLGENHFIRVIVKQHGKWLISSFQNTRIGPPPSTL